MSIYNLKKITALVPETEGLVKSADFDKDLSTDSKQETLLSYLEVQYLTKVAHEKVDYDDINRVFQAVELYGIQKEAQELSNRMLSNAARPQEPDSDVKLAQSYFEGQLTGLVDIEKVASHAEQLYDQFLEEITSDEVRRYAGDAYMNKEASVAALVYRARLTKDPEFVKLAKVIQGSKTNNFDSDDIRLICRTVTQLDKKAGLSRDFYREALIVKQAAMTSALNVTLAGKQIPVESLIRFGKERVGSVLGKDIGDEMFKDEDPRTIKQVAESLPLDIQKTLATLVTC